MTYTAGEHTVVTFLWPLEGGYAWCVRLPPDHVGVGPQIIPEGEELFSKASSREEAVAAAESAAGKWAARQPARPG